MSDFQSAKVEHHTFATGDQKLKKILRKAAPEQDHDELTREIESITRTAPKEIITIKSRRTTRTQTHTFNNEMNMNDIKKIIGSSNIKVKCETYSKKQTITQCHRWQE